MPKVFLEQISALNLSGIERAVALLWWHHKHESIGIGIDAKQLCNEIEGAGYGKQNVSRLREALKKDRRTVSNGAGNFRLNVKAIADLELQYLQFSGKAPARKLATDLRALMSGIKSAETRAFVEEAIKCYEYELYRSAVVMSWLAAVAVLHHEVLTKHLKEFNAEASKVDSKWKTAKTADDLGKMQEGQFLDRLVAISVIGKNVKTELKGCLDRRNACGHPNSYAIQKNTTAHHIETLIENVFKKF